MLDGIKFLEATGAEPIWFTHNLTICALGALAALEVAAMKSPEAEELLQSVDKQLKAVVAALSSLGVLTAGDRAFFQGAIQQAGIGDTVVVLLVGGTTWFLAALRGGIIDILVESDEDDDLGLRGLLSWCEDLWAGFGVILLLLYPVAMLLVILVVTGVLHLLKRYFAWREEKAKVACQSCGEMNYPCAVACLNCKTPLPEPCAVGFLGQAKTYPTPDRDGHPYRLAEKKRCPVCATRLKEKGPRQTCPACGHQLFADQGFADRYVSTVSSRLPTVLVVGALFSLIPVVGLIPGVIYYRIRLVGPFRRYMGLGKRFLMKWLLRLVFFLLIGLQIVPLVGALVVPIMALLGYTVYRAAFSVALDDPPLPATPRPPPPPPVS
ncbi:MAG: DUF4126 family protein [Lentisphaerae bacterium]|nr:DUF4126 family protein [Lentisphaerota bacterium]MBT4821873.1 DUF4126 family protein [Lentisphaerota bacterium]MBT7062103.1 DUF4126 family protein [Lentisphaerota bacterium]MBT7847910.1 DUF4126 family protein [Lentisphaerota bacterium]